MNTFNILLRITASLFFIILAATSYQIFASGLAVQPGTYLFRDIPVGKKFRLPVRLSVHNKGDKQHTYLLTPILPSNIGMTWNEGYTEIPDINWFSFEENELTIDESGKGSTNMYIEIPDLDAYYNQKWVIGLSIVAKPESGNPITLAVYPRYLLETENREEITGRPAGLTGVKPGKLKLLPTMNLENEELVGNIEIYNNDNIHHIYRLHTANPSDMNQGLSPTLSYEWMPDPKWIVLDKNEIKIAPGENQVLTVRLKITSDKFLRVKRWEALLFITPDNASSTFVRVLITP